MTRPAIETVSSFHDSPWLAWIVAGWLATHSTGCGGAKHEVADGGMDSSADVGVLVEAPMPTRAVQPFDCPPEWQRDALGCAPVPIPRCEVGRWARPGDEACRTVGTPCTEEWPEVAGPALYVRQDASGSGSTDDPGALEDMLDRASPGTTVVVAPGTYPGELALGPGVRLLGVCTRVVLTGAVSSDTGTLSIEGTDVLVENLTIAPLGQSAIVALDDTSLTLRDVSIVGASEIAIFLEGASLRAERLTIQEMRDPNPLAVYVGEGARLEGEEVYVRSARGVAILVTGGSASLSRSSVLDTGPDDDVFGGEPLAVGHALLLDDGGSATLEDVSLEGGVGAGVFVRGASSLVGRRVHLTGIRGAGNDAELAITRGSGMVVGEGAEVELEDVSIADVDGVALDVVGAQVTARRASLSAPVGAVVGATGRLQLDQAFVQGSQGGVASLSGSSVSVTDVVVTGSGPEDFQNPAFSVEDAELTVTRALVEDWRGLAVLARARATFRGEDLEVRRLLPTRFQPSGDRTTSAFAIQESEATIARASITDQTGVGIEVTRGTLDLEDLIVERIGPSEQIGARGLATFRGTVTLRRTSFRDVAGWAIDAYEESVIDAVDLHAEQLTPDYFGYGTALQARGASRTTVSRMNVVGMHGVGLRADDVGSTIEASNVTVRGISPRSCGMASCTDEPAGIGVLATDGARVSLQDFEVAEAALCGVMVGPDGVLELSRGSIRQCAVGACVREEGYPVERLTTGVLFEDNGLTVDSVGSPVPALPPAWAPPPR